MMYATRTAPPPIPQFHYQRPRQLRGLAEDLPSQVPTNEAFAPLWGLLLVGVAVGGVWLATKAWE